MPLRGLTLSAVSERDHSAYTHRVANLAASLERRGIPSDYFFMPDHPPLDTETTASLFMPLRIKTLRKYDFIYCGGEEAAQALFFCRKFVKARVIVDIHGDLLAQSALANQAQSGDRRTSASLRVKLIHRMGMAVADHLLTVCQPQTENFIEYGISVEKISLIRNGVDLEFFQPLPQPRDARFTFAYVGAFQVWQGIDNLIEAFQRFPNPSVSLLLVGFRPEDTALKQTIGERFGPRVEMVDKTDRHAMIELVESVSILIIPRIAHPAIRHAFPTKFAEYAALGRPIMVNDVDETADFVRTYECGFVSDPSPEGMARVMEIASRSSYETLREMGQRARKMAELHFSWDRIGDDYERVVRGVTSGHLPGKIIP
jgi:glycosyltransferase involved in cell wall biosynthesis